VKSLGFYALNGQSVYSAKDSHKKEDIADFLYEIRKKNPEESIVLVWDNAKAHLSRLVRRTAQLLDIILVFLPPYSPDLNPIEFIWKSIKKELSSRFLMYKEEVRDVVERFFYKFSSSLSFADSWIRKFLKPLRISLE
jgi:putative transposase